MIEIMGCTIKRIDQYNFKTSIKGTNKETYHRTFEDALLRVSNALEAKLEIHEIEQYVKDLKEHRANFIAELKEVVGSHGCGS